MELTKTKMIVEKLIEKNKTLSTMESCTGGGVANCITNIDGSSSIFKFGAVTYSNDFKIKMNVNENTIDKYSVYSIEVANEMSKNISDFAGADFGIGVTGKLNCEDEANPRGEKDKVFISIYSKSEDKYYNNSIRVTHNNRQMNKDIVIREIMDMLNSIL